MALATNTDAITFDATTASGTFDATHWGLYTAETGGTYLYGGSIVGDPAALALGGNYTLAAGALDIYQDATDASRLSQAGARRILAGLIDASTSTTGAKTGLTAFVGLHDADPEDDGSGEITGSDGVARESVANWTLSDANSV